MTLLGGRAAEEAVFDETYSGAADDLARVHMICIQMVTDFGMTFAPGAHEHVPLAVTSDYALSDRTRRDVDENAQELAQVAYMRAERTRRNYDRVRVSEVADQLRHFLTVAEMAGGEGLGEPGEQAPAGGGEKKAAVLELVELGNRQRHIIQQLVSDAECAEEVHDALNRATGTSVGALMGGAAPEEMTTEDLLAHLAELAAARREAIELLATERGALEAVSRHLAEAPIPAHDSPELHDQVQAAMEADTEAVIELVVARA